MAWCCLPVIWFPILWVRNISPSLDNYSTFSAELKEFLLVASEFLPEQTFFFLMESHFFKSEKLWWEPNPGDKCLVSGGLSDGTSTIHENRGPNCCMGSVDLLKCDLIIIEFYWKCVLMLVLMVSMLLNIWTWSSCFREWWAVLMLLTLCME